MRRSKGEDGEEEEEREREQRGQQEQWRMRRTSTTPHPPPAQLFSLRKLEYIYIYIWPCAETPSGKPFRLIFRGRGSSASARGSSVGLPQRDKNDRLLQTPRSIVGLPPACREAG